MKSGKSRGMPRTKRKGSQPPADNSDKAVGKRLRLLRLAFGKTQEEIGRIVGVKNTMISTCENGGGRLSADHMIKLLIEFDAPLEWLYLGWKRHLSPELRRKLDQVSGVADASSS
jgi:transcriptional regulator with XRE-family HTH domain